MGAATPEELHSVRVREAHVQEEEIGQELAGQRQALDSGRRREGLRALRGNRRRADFANPRFVVNNQRLQAGRRWFRLWHVTPRKRNPHANGRIIRKPSRRVKTQ